MNISLYETTKKDISPTSMKYIAPMLHCTSCIVTETRNGDYILEAKFLKTDPCYHKVSYQNFILAKPNPKDSPQLFEIYNIIKNLDGYSVKAKHIKHCMYNNVCEGGEVESWTGTPQYLFNNLTFIYENNFTFSSDIEIEKSMNLGYKNVCTLGDFFQGREGSLLDNFGGEYHYNNFNVELLNNRGKNTNYTIRYGTNISSIEQTISSETTVSSVVGYAKVLDTHTNRYIELHAEPYNIINHKCKTHKIELIDATELIGNMTVDSSNGEGYDFVKNSCRIAALMHFGSGGYGEISTNIKIDFRAELDKMQELSLCDTVNVIIDDKNTTISAKIVKTEYDALNERWQKLELGSLKNKLSDYF